MKDLKSILESLFDDDLVTKDVEFGFLYEMSDAAHHNAVSNDLSQVLRCFDKKKLEQQAAKTKNKVDRKNEFVVYWGEDEKSLPDLIDVILGMPAQLILSAQYSGGRYQRMIGSDEKLVKDYLDKFLSRPKDLSICVIKYPTKEETMYNIELYEGIFDSRPNRITLRFIEK